MKCQGHTAKGHACKSNTMKDSKFCKRHAQSVEKYMTIAPIPSCPSTESSSDVSDADIDIFALISSTRLELEACKRSNNSNVKPNKDNEPSLSIRPTVEIYPLVNSKHVNTMRHEEVAAYINTGEEGHERITGPCKPYFDFERDFDNEEDARAEHYSMAKSITARLTNHFKAPAKVCIFDRSGFNVKKSQTDPNAWRNSFHAVVSGAGFWRCGADMIASMPAQITEYEYLDTGVYHEEGKDQKFRLPYTPSKVPFVDARVLKRIKDCDYRSTVVEHYDCKTALALDGGIASWLITSIDSEVEQVATIRREKGLSNVDGSHSTMRTTTKPAPIDVSIFADDDDVPDCIPEHGDGPNMASVMAAFGFETPIVNSPVTNKGNTEERALAPPSHAVRSANADPRIKNIDAASIEALFEIIGYEGRNVSRDKWRDEIVFPLRGIMEDYGIDTRPLAHKISRSDNPSSYNEADTNALFDTAIHGAYKSLGVLRDLAKRTNMYEYKKWRMSAYGTDSSNIFNEPPSPPQPPSKEQCEERADDNKQPLKEVFFSDFRKFVNKEVSLETIAYWSEQTLTLIENGGHMYFLTKKQTLCPSTNKMIADVTTISASELMNALDVDVRIINPKYNPAIAETVDNKRIRKIKITAQEAEACDEFLYRCLGGDRGHIRGYLKSCLQKRTLKCYAIEDFIPYLKRRIPDAGIKAAVNNPSIKNSFLGFPYDGVRKVVSDIKFEGSLVHDHLKNIICNGDAGEYRNLAVSIADMIQRPYRVTGITHILYGPQGTGKSLTCAFVEALIGSQHTLAVHNMKTYGEKFNANQKTVIFKYFEEVGDKGKNYINHETIKYDATKLTTRIEIKNGAVFNVRNCARMWFLSNNENNMIVEGDDRRGVHHHVSNARVGDTVYFKELDRLMRDDKYMTAAFEYFADFEYEEDEARTAYDTAYKTKQKLHGLTNAIRAVKEIIEGDFTGLDPTYRDGDKIEHAAFYELYKRWCITNGTDIQKKHTFETQIERIGIVPPKPCKINGSIKRAYIINIDQVQLGFQEYLKTPTFKFD